MKLIKITGVILVFLMSLSSPATAREKASEDKNEKEVKVIYKKAKQALYQKEWSKAVKQLRQISEEFSESKLTDDSLYWLGYSMNRLSLTLENMDKILNLQEEALSQLDSLMKQYPTSKWIDDAKRLRVEIAENLVKKGFKQYKYILNGASIDPDTEMKLVALDALMYMDRESTFPILEKIIRTNKNPEMKEKAIFILSQTADPRVIALLGEVAIKDADKKIRKKAIFWLGQIREPESLNLLLKIYNNSDDPELKEKILFSIYQYGSDTGIKHLINLYKKERSLRLKKKIIFWLGQSRNQEANKFIEKILME